MYINICMYAYIYIYMCIHLYIYIYAYVIIVMITIITSQSPRCRPRRAAGFAAARPTRKTGLIITKNISNNTY